MPNEKRQRIQPPTVRITPELAGRLDRYAGERRSRNEAAREVLTIALDAIDEVDRHTRAEQARRWRAGAGGRAVAERRRGEVT
jgi:hypothetical protein